MRVTQKVKKILSNYESDNPGTKANICRLLMHGKLGGTGKMVILPVDQGFEHGPARSFAVWMPMRCKDQNASSVPHVILKKAVRSPSSRPR